MKRLTIVLMTATMIPVLCGSGSERWESRYVKVEATAYCGGPCKICGTTGITRTGEDATGGRKGVAVDPAIFPLGSRFDVAGYGVWVRGDDTGGAIKGHRIDLRMQSHEKAKAYGRKKITVRVWRKTK
jgi:3D (Asp-Asp-Asp) domain-containing protein